MSHRSGRHTASALLAFLFLFMAGGLMPSLAVTDRRGLAVAYRGLEGAFPGQAPAEATRWVGAAPAGAYSALAGPTVPPTAAAPPDGPHMPRPQVNEQFSLLPWPEDQADAGPLPHCVAGTVTEMGTDVPIVDALVSAGQATVRTDVRGGYVLCNLMAGGSIRISHPAYRPAQATPHGLWARQDVSLMPWELVCTVSDSVTDAPLVGAVVQSGTSVGTTDGQGRVTLRLQPGAPVHVASECYEPYDSIYQGQPALEVALEPSCLSLSLLSQETGQPVSRAVVQVFSDGPVPFLVRPDDVGQVTITHTTRISHLTIKAPGYQRLTVPLTTTRSLEQYLIPFQAQGVYIPFGLLTVPQRVNELLDMIDETELNAVVVDVKSDRARLAWKSAVPLAVEIGAYQPGVMDIQAFLQACRERNIYTIARLVLFKDDLLARQRPDFAVQRVGGRPYVDWEGLRWADPFQKPVVDYMLALTKEVAEMGFDEVQFDYLRFPSDGQVKNLAYDQESSLESRTAAMADFCRQAHEVISLTPAFLSADVFGLTVWVDGGDMGIGQRIEDIAPYMDYISPMLYPSTFASGNLGLDTPQLYPYEILQSSVLKLQERTTTLVRPWLQHYSLGGITYGPAELLKQKKGAEDAGSCGWLYWNAAGRYRAEIFQADAYDRYLETPGHP